MCFIPFKPLFSSHVRGTRPDPGKSEIRNGRICFLTRRDLNEQNGGQEGVMGLGDGDGAPCQPRLGGLGGEWGRNGG